MPLPLLLFPLAASAATSSGVSIVTLIGSIVGAFSGGGIVGGISFYLFNGKNHRLSEEHEKSIVKQDNMIRERIDETKKQVESIYPKINTIAATVEEASNTIEQSTQELNSVNLKIELMSTALITGVKLAKETSDNLASISSEIKTSTEETINITQETITQLEELNSSLKLKDGELKKCQEDMTGLQQVLDAQIITNNHLNNIVQIVSDENNELKNSQTKLQKKIEILEPQIQRLVVQVRFFKNAVQQVIPKEELQSKNNFLGK